jgi:hypothetical protein
MCTEENNHHTKRGTKEAPQVSQYFTLQPTLSHLRKVVTAPDGLKAQPKLNFEQRFRNQIPTYLYDGWQPTDKVVSPRP